jgi:hypothetical protein
MRVEGDRRGALYWKMVGLCERERILRELILGKPWFMVGFWGCSYHLTLYINSEA